MKRIEWLKREIHKELESWQGVEGGIDGDGINEIILLIDQLDEPEVLSQEFIDERAEYYEYIGYAVVPVDDLQNLLVPKQEEVDQAYKDGYEKGQQHATEKQPEETGNSRRVLVDYLIASAKLKLALSMEVEELEE